VASGGTDPHRVAGAAPRGTAHDPSSRGASRTLKRAPSAYLGTNVVFANSGAFSPAVMLGAVLEVGADAVMFCVDYPYESSYEAVQGFERTTLSGSDREKIARGNAERLLRIG
jgi:2,3-dihydroxybenzoate decarboxylase